MPDLKFIAWASPAIGLVALGWAVSSLQASPPGLSAGQSNYVEYCAGCHGMQGSSAPAQVPELRGRVGHFLCTPEGRDYVIRLPNVAHAPISDDNELAELMNFVVFKLGGSSVRPGARPFSAAEVARLRSQPLAPGDSLLRIRARIVDTLIRNCGAPADLRDMYAASFISQKRKNLR